MSSTIKYPPQVCVVIPTFNPNIENLNEALQSLANQSLQKALFEIVVVDDCSDNKSSSEFLKSLSQLDFYQEVACKTVRHDKNEWLAQARRTGAEATECPFVVFLDDDDMFEKDYLEKCLILMHATPEADWVYANIRKFGQRNELKWAENFSFLKMFFKNGMAYSSMFRRNAWLKVGQRNIQINDRVRIFEDWDMYIRMISRGSFGTPLSDTVFHYRKSPGGLAARSVREYAISVYVNYRMHLWRLVLFPFGVVKHRRFLRRGHSRLSGMHPVKYVNQLSKFVAKKFLHLREIPAVLDGRSVMMALFQPKKFESHLLNDHTMMSLALMRSGFDSAPDMSFTKGRCFPHQNHSNTLLAGHIWWQMGGAENIFLEWVKSAYSAGADKIIDLVAVSHSEQDVLQESFAAQVDIQYSISRFGETPYQRLRSIWNLLLLEQPKLVFISSNSFLYYLTPYIKKELPNIKIIDILHNEYDGLIDWFSISSDFQEYIDCRVVTNDYWKQVLVDTYHEDDSKVVVADNPVDTELYNPENIRVKSLRRSFKLHPKKKTIAFIGRLHEQKGLDVFLAVADIMSGFQDFQFVVAGDGDLREHLLETIKVSNNVSFLGYFRTVEKILGMSDVLICPSLYEGAPVIGIECAAMNTALIAPNIVGFREQILDGDFGILYESSRMPQRDACLIKSILVERYEELIDLGNNGRRFAINKHSLPVVRKTYKKILSQYLDSTQSDPNNMGSS